LYIYLRRGMLNFRCLVAGSESSRWHGELRLRPYVLPAWVASVART